MAAASGSGAGGVASAYDTVAEAYADHFAGVVPETAADLAMIADFLGLLPAPGTVLDAGCGTGRLFGLLGAQGRPVTGLDASAGMLARARRDHPGVPVVQGSLVDLPFPDEAFAGAFSWYSTVHVPDADLRRALAELVRVTAPGGPVLVACQTGSGVRDIGGAFAPLSFDVTLPRWHRSPDALAAGLDAVGAVEEARLVRGPRGTEADGQAVLIARRPGDPSDR